MIMNFAPEEIRLLAECEKDMDCGKQPFVRVEGATGRMAVSEEIMIFFGLTSGQTISPTIQLAILRKNVDNLNRQIMEQEGKPE